MEQFQKPAEVDFQDAEARGRRAPRGRPAAAWPAGLEIGRAGAGRAPGGRLASRLGNWPGGRLAGARRPPGSRLGNAAEAGAGRVPGARLSMAWPD